MSTLRSCTRMFLFSSHSTSQTVITWVLFGVWKIDGAPDKLLFCVVSSRLEENENTRNIRLKHFKSRASESCARAVHGKDVSNLQGHFVESERNERMLQWDFCVCDCWAMCVRAKMWSAKTATLASDCFFFLITGSRLVTVINQSGEKKIFSKPPPPYVAVTRVFARPKNNSYLLKSEFWHPTPGLGRVSSWNCVAYQCSHIANVMHNRKKFPFEKIFKLLALER